MAFFTKQTRNRTITLRKIGNEFMHFGKFEGADLTYDNSFQISV